MLETLTGRTHTVCTGVCICSPGGPEPRCFHELTEVTFRALDRPSIEKYLDQIDPLDKAGGYAAQEHGSMIIEETKGSWTNVVGLPMEKVESVLQELLGTGAAPAP